MFAASLPDVFAEAMCRNDPDLWFSTEPVDRRLAADWCAVCPAQEQCLILGARETHGIWGGKPAGWLGRFERRKAAAEGRDQTVTFTAHKALTEQAS